MIKATSIKWDTTPLPKRYTDSKKVKQCLKTQVKGFFYLSLNQFLPLCIIKMFPFLVSLVKFHKRKPVISKAFIQKIFPSCDGSWFSHYLACTRNGILIEPETARLPFMSCRRCCDIWTVSERGGAEGRGDDGK